MINILDKTKCCGCGACYNICPKHCIQMEYDEEGFIYPKVDINECTHCNLCENACQYSIEGSYKKEKPLTYAALIKNDEIRIKSSSGGVFYGIANKVLENHGVVYGVAMTDNCRQAVHTRIDNTDDLEKVMGSKYLQSNINEVYRCIESDLQEGREVLFSGTPCQVDGLKLFLKREYDGLLLVDVICHGVPSPKLWNKYCDYLENKYHGQIAKVNFREKPNGWKDFGIKKQ